MKLLNKIIEKLTYKKKLSKSWWKQYYAIQDEIFNTDYINRVNWDIDSCDPLSQQLALMFENLTSEQIDDFYAKTNWELHAKGGKSIFSVWYIYGNLYMISKKPHVTTEFNLALAEKF